MDPPASSAQASESSFESATPLNPVTPKAKSQQHLLPKYTPINRGAASKEQSNDPKQNRDQDFRMYLTEDWKQKVVIDFDQFLPHLLRVSIKADAPYFNADNAPPQVRDLWDNKYSSDWNQYAPMQNTVLADSIAQEPEYKRLKQLYRKAQTEQDQYEPFAGLVNYVITRLREHRLGGKAKATDEAVGDKLVLVPADRKSVQESAGKMYPDLLAIRERNRVKVDEDGTVHDRATIEGQKAYPFSWSEPVFFVELMKKSTFTKETDPAKTPSFLKDKLPAMPLGISESVQGPNFKKRKHPEARATGFTTKKPKMEPVFSDSLNSGSGSASYHSSPHLVSESSASCSLKHGVVQETQDGVYYQLKCTKYALNMLSYGGLRTFVYGLLLQGNSLQVASYQRSSIIVTKSFHFLDQDRQFIGLLEGLERLTDSQFGFGDLLVAPDTEPKKLEMNNWRRLVGATLKLSDNKKLEKPVKITVSEVLYFQRAVLCRGSFVVAGEVVENLPPAWNNALQSSVKNQDADSAIANTVSPPKIVIVKASTVPLDREPEARFIEVVREGAEADPRKKWLLKRLPEVLFWQQAAELDEHEIRSAFALNGNKPKYELRTLRVLVFVPLEPITKIKNPVELLRVYIDLIEAHKSLVKDFKVLHRDISLNNMMCRIQMDEKGVVRIVGVINDLDLAVFIVDGQGTSPHRQRTGTQPFMANELLKRSPVRHYPRHDLESFYYILLHHCTHYDLDPEIEEIVQVADPPYADWARLSFEALYHERSTFWMENDPVRASLHFRSVFNKPISQFQQLIKKGADEYAKFLHKQSHAVMFDGLDLKSVAKITEGFNLKTWGGILTHDKVISILKEGLVAAINNYKESGPRDQTIEAVSEGREADFGNEDPQWECDSKEDKIILRNLIAVKAKEPIPSEC